MLLFFEEVNALDNEILSQNLKMLRKNHKLTQIEVAELIGKERSLIAKYESGKAVPPLNILQSFAKLYNVSVDDLCGKYKPSGDSIILESGGKSRISYSDLLSFIFYLLSVIFYLVNAPAFTDLPLFLLSLSRSVCGFLYAPQPRRGFY